MNALSRDFTAKETAYLALIQSRVEASTSVLIDAGYATVRVSQSENGAVMVTCDNPAYLDVSGVDRILDLLTLCGISQETVSTIYEMGEDGMDDPEVSADLHVPEKFFISVQPAAMLQIKRTEKRDLTIVRSGGARVETSFVADVIGGEYVGCYQS